MSGFIKKSLLFWYWYCHVLVYHCLLLSLKKCIYLIFDEFCYYPFIISMTRCDGSCSTAEDPFDRIYIPNEVGNVNMKVLNIIEGMYESNTSTKHLIVNVNLMVGNKAHGKNGTIINVTLSVKSQYYIAYVERIMCEDSGTCASKCDKDCDMGKYLKYRTCMKSLAYDLVVT